MPAVSLPDQVRDACAWVAGRARFVRIDEGKLGTYVAILGGDGAGASEEAPLAEGGPEAAAAFAICMNAINFGSGWWPTIRKRPGHSGFATMAAGLGDRFAELGPWRAEELVAIDATTLAAVLGQEPEHPLMAQFAAALRDVGRHLLGEHGGCYLGVVESASSVPDLAAVFAGWDSFADVSPYDGRRIPFFKRAQLAAADLHRAGVAALPGIEQLTAAGAGYPAAIDSALWNRGRGRRYKSRPRPRSRNIAY
jgi:hypothetical protein